MSQQSAEPFPELLPNAQTAQNHKSRPNGAPKPRRKSSSLGGDPRGDTGGLAFATMSAPGESKEVQMSSEKSLKPHSKRRKARSAIHRFVRYSLRHTWLVPLILIVTILSLYLVNPTTSNPFHACIFLSYPLPRPADAAPDTPLQYGKGSRDVAFVFFYVIVFSFTREFLMQRMIRPLAIRWGIKRRAKQSRFMEQFYTAVYFGIFGPLGMYVMYRSPVWYFNTHGMFDGFPHRSHEALFKAYYLLQASYWAQQGLVLMLMLEKPRKDFKELVLHHVVTLSLIWLSYRFHFTYVGVAVYITHDISDFFLATSKVLNYVDSPITEPYFILFMGMWIYMRHFINLKILWAVLTDFTTVGPYELDWENEQYKCWISQIISFFLLAMLQMVNLFWLFLIFRIAYRFAVTKAVADERSEDEEDEEEDHEREKVLEKRDHEKETPKMMINGSPLEDETVASGRAAAKETVTRRSSRRQG